MARLGLGVVSLVRSPDLAFKHDGDPEDPGKPGHDRNPVQPGHDRHADHSGSGHRADADHPAAVEQPQSRSAGSGLRRLKAAIFLALMIVLGTRIIPRVMKSIANWNSRELFLVATTAIGLGIGYGTYLFGLSFAFGAFVAGMLLSESDFGYQALSDIIPLRDIFSLLFFTSIGMLLDPQFLLDHLGMVLFLVLIVMLGKGLIFAALSRLFRYRNVIPWQRDWGFRRSGNSLSSSGGSALRHTPSLRNSIPRF